MFFTYQNYTGSHSFGLIGLRILLIVQGSWEDCCFGRDLVYTSFHKHILLVDLESISLLCSFLYIMMRIEGDFCFKPRDLPTILSPVMTTFPKKSLFEWSERRRGKDYPNVYCILQGSFPYTINWFLGISRILGS